MKDRIRELMEDQELTAAKLADTLDVGRAVVSHILNGRNNPSLDFVSRILESFPTVNPDWLLFGSGEMYREDLEHTDKGKIDTKGNESTLFAQADLFSQNIKQSSLDNQSVISNIDKQYSFRHSLVSETKLPLENATQDSSSIVEKIIYKELPPKKITQIIIYYDDNTYEIFQTTVKN